VAEPRDEDRSRTKGAKERAAAAEEAANDEARRRVDGEEWTATALHRADMRCALVEVCGTGWAESLRLGRERRRASDDAPASSLPGTVQVVDYHSSSPPKAAPSPDPAMMQFVTARAANIHSAYLICCTVRTPYTPAVMHPQQYLLCTFAHTYSQPRPRNPLQLLPIHAQFMLPLLFGLLSTRHWVQWSTHTAPTPWRKKSDCWPPRVTSA
jgi:hypothetical protein